MRLRGFQLELFSRLLGFKSPARAVFKPAKKSLRNQARTDQSTLQPIWLKLIDDYFPERQDLKDYHISWASRRQKRVLGSCNITKRRVRIARELMPEEHKNWAEAVLYHELCHAVIGKHPVRRNGKRVWHGTEFKLLEKLHPLSRELNIWVKSGGWQRAVRSDRVRNTWKLRKKCG